jgi:ribosomal protein S18 acetylase RimI-like enzyme
MTSNLQIDRLREGQHQDYWNAVEIMQHNLGSTCPQVHNLYPQLGNVPRTYVARAGPKIVGGLIWKYYDKIKAMQIEFLAVDPELHRRGIGSRLVAAFENHAAECVAKQAEISRLMLDANHTNYTFFERLGWGFVDERPALNFWGPVEMVKDIG